MIAFRTSRGPGRAWRGLGASTAALVGMALLPASAASADTVTLINSTKDATLIQQASGALANGSGFAIFAGRVGFMGAGTLRRGLIKFELDGVIPPGSTINSVSLTLWHMVINNGTQTVRLHRVLTDWSEGASKAPGGQGVLALPGDCTWLHVSYPDEFWSTLGGDFVAARSASTIVSGISHYTWNSTPALVADVQGWVDNPAANFGWLVMGNESGALQTSKKFARKE